MKKILITGAAGFIGYHLALFLKKKGEYVIGYDNFNSYYDVFLKRSRESNLKKENIIIIEGDIQDQKKLKSLIEEHQITHFIHLAAQAGVRHSLSAPKDYVDSNLNGFISVLETLKDYPHIPFVFASSSSVYGLNSSIPFSESDSTDSPTNLYGATKKAGETLSFAYHHLYKIPIIGLRYFTVYGPWGRPDMAYFRFTENILNEKPISVFNHGNMQRDFTYIDDIVEGTAAALDHKTGYEIFNLGNNKPIHLLQMIETLEMILGKKAIKKMFPPQPGEMTKTYADISKSQSLLKFNPTISLEEGLSRFVSWYQQYQESKNHFF